MKDKIWIEEMLSLRLRDILSEKDQKKLINSIDRLSRDIAGTFAISKNINKNEDQKYRKCADYALSLAQGLMVIAVISPIILAYKQYLFHALLRVQKMLEVER